jgi:tRNA (mo5U34)-methyltransferase
MPSPEELQAQADELGWFHTIDLGNGVVTKGLSELALSPDQLPDFEGKTVLDIGAWDGYYSFLAEKGGASRVVALDHYAWGVDFVARGAYWNECFASGTLPDQARDMTDFWRPDLPGSRGFKFAAAALDSKVEPYVADFATADLSGIGTFDVSLYLGVLYHMKEPLTCLERLRSVTNDVAVIETEALHLQNEEHLSLLQFHSGGDIQTDFGNWFVPTMTGLHSLCHAAGFSSVSTVQGPPTADAPPAESTMNRVARRVRGVEPPNHFSAPTAHYRAVVHAFV